MPQPGYQEGGEPLWWWKAAMHLDEAQLALANAMAHNVDDPRLAHALYDRLREGQAILLEIFRAKGLLPGSTNGRGEVPMPEMSMPPGPVSGVPVPMATGGEAAVAAPTTDAEQRWPLATEETVVPEADQVAVASQPEQPAAAGPSPEVVVPAAIASEAPSVSPPAESGAGGAGG